MHDQNQLQPSLDREISAPSAELRPMGMSPMLNMATTTFKGRGSDVSIGEWKSNLQTTFVLQGVPAEFKAELTLCCLEGIAKGYFNFTTKDVKHSQVNFL